MGVLIKSPYKRYTDSVRGSGVGEADGETSDAAAAAAESVAVGASEFPLFAVQDVKQITNISAAVYV